MKTVTIIGEAGAGVVIGKGQPDAFPGDVVTLEDDDANFLIALGKAEAKEAKKDDKKAAGDKK